MRGHWEAKLFSLVFGTYDCSPTKSTWGYLHHTAGYSGTCCSHSTSGSPSSVPWLEPQALSSYSVGLHQLLLWNRELSTVGWGLWLLLLFVCCEPAVCFPQNSSCGKCMRPKMQASSSRQDLLSSYDKRGQSRSWVAYSSSSTPYLHLPDSRFQKKTE